MPRVRSIKNFYPSILEFFIVVKVWLDVRKLNQRGPRLFNVNSSLLENPNILQKANEQINTMIEQMDASWKPHLKLEYFKVCVRSTMMAMGQKNPM